MIQTIQSDILKILDNLIIYDNNKVSRNIITHLIKKYLNNFIINNKILDFKIICDESNNTEIDYVYIDIQIYSYSYICPTIIEFVIKINKISMLRKLRKSKLKEIYK